MKAAYRRTLDSANPHTRNPYSGSRSPSFCAHGNGRRPPSLTRCIECAEESPKPVAVRCLG